MKDKLETLTAEPLMLGEVIKAEIFRGGAFGYSSTPDETVCVNDLIPNSGRIYLAKRISGGDTVASAMAHIAVGTGTASPALGDTALVGEYKRKATAINSALTNNIWSAVSTFGGAADSITSLSITEAGVFNHASSGQGTMFQRVTFSSVTLADSDLFRIELQTVVGSNQI